MQLKMHFKIFYLSKCQTHTHIRRKKIPQNCSFYSSACIQGPFHRDLTLEAKIN